MKWVPYCVHPVDCEKKAYWWFILVGDDYLETTIRSCTTDCHFYAELFIDEEQARGHSRIEANWYVTKRVVKEPGLTNTSKMEIITSDEWEYILAHPNEWYMEELL